MRPLRRPVLAVLTGALALGGLTACTEKSDAKAGEDGAIGVTAADTTCDTTAKTAKAGKVTLAIANKGKRATEVEIVMPDGRIVSEKENIGPGVSYTLTAEVKAGDYEIACRPGMVGHGVRQKLTVSGKESGAKRDPRLDAAVSAYRDYAQDQADQTLPKVKVFTDAIRAGELDAAKKAYAPSRIGWERTEPVAESFGDIDPKTDTRADGLEKGQKWTGWHRLEKALFEDGKIGAEEKTLATRLDTDLKDWQRRVGRAVITPTSMANGAKDLLDEVATGKVTGEEERYSHTDLVDFKANVEGAEKAYTLLRAVAKTNDPDLVARLDTRFAALDKQLDAYRPSPDSYEFTSYDKVGEARRKKLSDGVNALAEPLSKLAAAVVGK
ncbi:MULTISPECIES: iron uptake system protein EfeO [Streptomyces]|uniref:Iron uptake system protein EfeO n=1 Tax=Streptomyces evansiae TaxID=3075535 RepID=A0ABU2R5Y1_9ACTN|nr:MULTISPECIES: iron uptake system protein EfeO [unclassified Streptomyces]MDT0412101.1 iron uptake system protein EfeO [Streptomyces sp. DSM 41979]MYQ59143.1 peptidase M75 [Streptomyces sp. SID4926]SCE16438.1 iron uptake system component EfeO [Streptomyces sp. DfronAA-171]